MAEEEQGIRGADYAPVAAPSSAPGASRDHGFSKLEKVSSTGTWGEQSHGEPVDVDQARRDFQQASEENTLSRRKSRTQANDNAPAISRSRSRGTAEPHQAPIAEARDLEEGGQQGDEQLADEEDDDDFDLGTFIQARKNRLQEQGIDNSKPVGLSWRNVNVRAPGAGGGGMIVKTLPKAILNTVTTDPIGVACFVFPPLRKLLQSSNGASTPLIQGHSGVLRAGEMLLVLGRPGSGCSTALRALTATSHSNVVQTGDISFSGLSPDDIEKHLRGEVLFCDEDDIHFPTLTVQQTLEFALKNKAPTRSKRLSGETRDNFIKLVSDVVLKMFGMTHVRDTIVGDAFTRGVSGGERKRVTISEALIGGASIVAWDNSTRGLDASTALDYVRSLRIMTDLSQRTTMATLYQVSESIYNYFDRVAVVDDGLLIYYGPRDQCKQYFTDLGYFSPHRQTTADFVTTITDPDLVAYRDGYEKSAPKSAVAREEAWRKSDLYRQLIGQIDEFDAQVQQSQKKDAQRLQEVSASVKNRGVRHTSPYTVSFWQQVKACIWRQLLIRWGSRVDLQIKLFTIVSISFIIGALFYGEPYDSTGVFTRGGVILFLCLFNGWLQLSEGFEAVAGRPMLARHRQFAFHRPSAVVIARAIVDVPFLLIQCLITVIIVWGIADLRRTAGAFFLYLLYTFLAAYNLTALYRCVASFSATFLEAIRFSVLSLNIIIIFVGYVIRRPQMNWMIFLSYINGISYAFEGMLTNEIAYDIPCAPAQIVPFGEARDVTYQTCALTGAEPGSLVVNPESYLNTTFGYRRFHVSYNWAVIIAFTIIYFVPTIIAAEVIDWTGGGGGITVFAPTKAAKQKLKGQGEESKHAGDVEAAGAGNEKKRSTSLQADDSSREITSGNSSSIENGSDSTRAPSREHANAEEQREVAFGQNGAPLKSKPTPSDFDRRAIFTWKDVNLTLPSGRKLLHEVDGWVKPGEMTALMGASGAGKTTLMSALSQRGVAGVVTGDMLIDGKKLDRGFQKGTGLVLQGDVHLATQTVREAFEFSARLRQPADVSDDEKMKTVEHVLDTLELRPLQDALIGIPGAGLGVERRKRVTIGVELVARPDLLLFLDEPTSGLDSAGAASIVRLLRRLAGEGQAILCTIHQPSSLLFEAFDNVLLLKPGGETAYFGQIGERRAHGSERIRGYFEENGAPSCPPEENAAEYILEVVSGGLGGKNKDWGKIWRDSMEAKNVRNAVDHINSTRAKRPANVDPRAARNYSAHTWVQIREVTKRQIVDTWRDPSFSYGVLFSNFVVGLVAGGAFAQLGTSPTALQNRVFITFLIMLNTPAMVNTVLTKVFTLRMLFEVRENESRIYGWWALITSFLVISVPIVLICSVLFFLPSYFIPFYSQPSWSAGFFYLNVLTMQFWMFFFAFMLAASCPTPVTAANLLPFALPIVAICSGIIVPHAAMPEPFYSFVYYVNPIAYYVRGQVATILHDQRVSCAPEDTYPFNTPPGQTCEAYAGDWVRSVGGQLITGAGSADCGFCQYQVGDQFAETVSAIYSFRWQNYGIFLGFTVFEIFASFACYWYFSVRRYGLGITYVTDKLIGLVKKAMPSSKSL